MHMVTEQQFPRCRGAAFAVVNHSKLRGPRYIGDESSAGLSRKCYALERERSITQRHARGRSICVENHASFGL